MTTPHRIASGFLEEGLNSNLPFMNPPSGSGDELNIIAAFKLSSVRDIRKAYIDSIKIHQPDSVYVLDLVIKTRDGETLLDTEGCDMCRSSAPGVGDYVHNLFVGEDGTFLTYVVLQDKLEDSEGTYEYDSDTGEITPFCIRYQPTQVNSVLVAEDWSLPCSDPGSEFPVLDGDEVPYWEGDVSPYLRLVGGVTLKSGWNTELDFQRIPGEIIAEFSQGAGAGSGPPPGESPSVLRALSGIGADENGNVNLVGVDCYTIHPRMVNSFNQNKVQQAPHQLSIGNTCNECCTCADYESVYRSLLLTNNVVLENNLHNRLGYVGNGYNSLVNMFNNASACRAHQRDTLECHTKFWGYQGWLVSFQAMVLNQFDCMKSGDWTFSVNFGEPVEFISGTAHLYIDEENTVPITTPPSGNQTPTLTFTIPNKKVASTRYMMIVGVARIIGERKIGEPYSVSVQGGLSSGGSPTPFTGCESVLTFEEPINQRNNCLPPLATGLTVVSGNCLMIQFETPVELFASGGPPIESRFKVDVFSDSQSDEGCVDPRSATSVQISGSQVTVCFDGGEADPSELLGLTYLGGTGSPRLQSATACPDGTKPSVRKFSYSVNEAPDPEPCP